MAEGNADDELRADFNALTSCRPCRSHRERERVNGCIACPVQKENPQADEGGRPAQRVPFCGSRITLSVFSSRTWSTVSGGCGSHCIKYAPQPVRHDREASEILRVKLVEHHP